ncbi:MAG: hypothetical protein LBH43_02565 [Treponema sp.]|jgi:hypothetical protein|nr:hypothetical protein [Treponema sp.]
MIMIGFLLKKNFYDLWDNLFRIVLLNVGFMASIAFPFLAPSLFTRVPLLGLFFLVSGIVWCFIYMSAAALSLKSVSDYGSFGFADFFSNIKKGWPWGLAALVLAFICFLLVTVIIPFYFFQMSQVIGFLLAAFVFWAMIAGVLSFQFFFAIRARLDTRPFKVIKKCLIIFFDNSGFCFFTLLGNMAMLALSVLTAFLFPGPAGILLFIDQGLRLRLLKYDWLEANPGANRKKIPWDAILIEEREKTGNRSFKNFIFPWKD